MADITDRYTKPERLSLVNHPELTEKWVQARIKECPSILGLGKDLVLKDEERRQPRAGRLDLLFQERVGTRRYEVELQLGPTDESHIIRTIEYWDIERKRYPQYDHAAVIVAEDITSRFLNVISLFNGSIPLIAIQMSALRVGEHLSLVFTTVLNELDLGLVDDDEEVQKGSDRGQWEQWATKETVQLADKLLALIKKHDSSLELKYNQQYIGLARNGKPNNFIIFIPNKKTLSCEVRLPRTDELDGLIESAGLDQIAYDRSWGRYRLRLSDPEIGNPPPVLLQMIERAFKGAKG